MASRREQLREAKRAQRLKDRQAGQVLYQLKLPAALRDRLKTGVRSASFVVRLHAFLRREILRVDDYPGLALLCWNRDIEYVTREDAFRLYERNWRLVDHEYLTDDERRLIEALKAEFGQSTINA
jgi:hypothetical protein